MVTRACAAALALAVLVPGLASGATPADLTKARELLVQRDPEAAERLVQAEAMVAGLRNNASGESIQDAVTAMVSLPLNPQNEVADPPSELVAAMPSWVGRLDVDAELNEALAQGDLTMGQHAAVVELTAATVGALGLLDVAFPDRDAAQRAALDVRRFMAEAPELLRAEEQGQRAGALEVRVAELERASGAAVNQDALRSAAVLLATAIDSVLPRLRAGSAAAVRDGAAAAGCDVADVAPLLCVGGMAVNLHDEGDYAITVDLGGDDRWMNDAGSSDINTCGAEPEVCLLGVAVDVGGNDTYAATFKGLQGVTLDAVAHGAAWGGVGFLVDASGNDRYSVEMLADENGQMAKFFGQASATEGVALLADLGGDDTYSLLQSTDGFGVFGYGDSGETLHIVQGVGALGWGALVDAGFGTDSYAGNAPAHDEPTSNVPGIWGQGLGLLGVGVLVDGGGDGRMGLDVAAHRRIPPSSKEWCATFAGNHKPVNVFGQARGVSGTGVVLSGVGNTEYSMTGKLLLDAPAGDLEGPCDSSWTWVGGQANNGLLADAGGDDTYRLHSELNLRIDAGGGSSEQAIARVVADGRAMTHGQGRGELFRPGVLLDAGGDDLYETIAASDFSVRATADSGDAKINVRRASPTEASAQGVLTGLLIDTTGSDRYLLAADSALGARAISPGVSETVAYQPPASADGLGNFAGYVVDTSAVDADVITVRARTITNTFPDGPRGSAVPGRATVLGVFGGGFLGTGKTDVTIDAVTPPPAAGQRGRTTPWVNDLPYVGGGSTLQPVPRSGLEVTLMEARRRMDGDYQLSAQLSSNGQPLEGRELFFAVGTSSGLEGRADGEHLERYYGQYPLGGSVGITGPDGTATVIIDDASLFGFFLGQEGYPLPEPSADRASVYVSDSATHAADRAEAAISH